MTQSQGCNTFISKPATLGSMHLPVNLSQMSLSLVDNSMSKDKATLPDTRCGSLPWWLEAEPPAHRHCSTAHQQPALVVWQDFRSVRNTPHHQMVISYRLFGDQGKHTDSDSSPSQQTIPPWAFQLPFRCKSTESLPFPKTLPL